VKDKIKVFDIVLVAIIVLAVLFVFRVASPHPVATSHSPPITIKAERHETHNLLHRQGNGSTGLQNRLTLGRHQ